MTTLLVGTILVLTLASVNWVVVHDFIYTPREEVKKRLESYALMLEPNLSDRERSQVAESLSASKEAMLTDKQHRILLGVLKKVEAKNSTLARVFTFLGAPCIALAANPNLGRYSELALLAVAYTSVFLITAIRGMFQVDQLSSRDLDVQEMQNALIRDMLIKEAELRYGIFGATFGVALMYFSVLIILIINA